jgi:TPR repeat protein
MQARGEGLPKDEARAFATFEQLCNDGLPESCTQWAVILASHPQKPDMAKARQILTKSCGGGFAQACEMLKSMPK